MSAFGGILALNRPVEASLVDSLGELFLELIIAPGFSEEARAKLAAKKNLRLLIAEKEDHPSPYAHWVIEAVGGGFLVQQQDQAGPGAVNWKPATGGKINAAQQKDAELAFHVVKYVKSNAIVLVKDGATIGVGAGQMSRVDSVRIAIEKARQHGHDPKGSVLASDAFLPFADNVELSAAAESPSSSSPAARCATRKSSPPPRSTASPCCSPAHGISGIDLCHSGPSASSRPVP